MSRPGLDGHALAARYEALRREVVDPEGCRHAVPGLALFVRQGMAAWMKGVEEAPIHHAAIPTASAAPRILAGIERNLIDIVAAMALATALAGRHDF
jgi:hypothetical protein